jgi:hypothetical protein
VTHPRDRVFLSVLSVFIVLSLAVSTGCALRRFAPPTGPGLPAPDGPSAWAEATRVCRAVGTYSATMFLSVRVADEGYPGITVFGGLTAAGSFLLQGRAGVGQRIFDLAGRPDRATLVLYREERHDVDHADLILEALVGIRVGPERLLAMLTGCVSTSDTVVRAERHGDLLEIDTGDGRVFLRRRDQQWQPRAGFVEGVEVDFVRIAGGWPQEINVFTEPGRSPEASLRVVLENLQINLPLNPAAFDLAVPENSVPITLEELRAGGPLRERGSG